MPTKESRSADFNKLFNDSFERIMARGSEAFYQRFYEHFIAASPEVAKAFANTDMERQYDMLSLSLMQIMSFASDRRSNPYIEKIANIHARLSISSDLFGMWGRCLIATVREMDDHYDAHVELAWRVTIAPGLEFMRAYCELAE
ncbi:globin [Simiduia curdlanivorans]|uniref:Globin n=1 Tax=Simiduia curdlanivorans TaxID=1492769 RepID=A0ABV8V3U6_9GAMM|nr:globin [Simiduia curdlanivorans]MDN3638194.1 globin [Simiduia curdlanivorans]